jgi:NADH-quinone oxidoreductase subunit L
LLPKTHPAFLASALTLAALPPPTLTFNSKDVILNQALQLPHGGHLLWTFGLIGAFLTAFYAFRLFLVVFAGSAGREPITNTSRVMVYAFGVLAFLAVFSGLPELIKVLTGSQGFYDFLQTAMPRASETLSVAQSWGLQAIYATISIIAIGLTYALYVRGRKGLDAVVRMPSLGYVHRFLKAGCGFDWLYANAVVQPYVWLARANRDDVLDDWSRGLAQACRLYHHGLSASITGNVRWYVGGIVVGSLIVLTLVIVL